MENQANAVEQGFDLTRFLPFCLVSGESYTTIILYGRVVFSFLVVINLPQFNFSSSSSLSSDMSDVDVYGQIGNCQNEYWFFTPRHFAEFLIDRFAYPASEYRIL